MFQVKEWRQYNIESKRRLVELFYPPLFVLIKTGPCIEVSKSKSSLLGSSEQNTVCFIRFSCSSLRRGGQNNIESMRTLIYFISPIYIYTSRNWVLYFQNQ